MFGLNTRSIGDSSEDWALGYLKKQGYKILERNFTIRGGEIDIIARDGEFLVFIEVKARNSAKYGLAKESITYWKLKALKKSALFYILKIKWGDKPYRFDLLAIDHDKVNSLKTAELIKNITF